MISTCQSQRLGEISLALEILHTHRFSHHEKAADVLQDGLEQIHASLSELITSEGVA
jgi:hypothetical protein